MTMTQNERPVPDASDTALVAAPAGAPAAAETQARRFSLKRGTRKKKKDEKPGNGVVETIKTVVYAVLIALVIRSFAYEPFNIPSRSMLPTLEVGDYLFVSKFSYGFSAMSSFYGAQLFDGRILAGEPQRGDVAVFKLPRDPRQDYIKRVIGLPGDTVQMQGGRLYINGALIQREEVGGYTDDEGRVMKKYVETLPLEGGKTLRHNIVEIGDNEEHDDTQLFTVPPGHYFMMGDNRDNSLDSRVSPTDPISPGVGFVPYANFVGRAEFIFFSLDSGTAFYEIWRWPWSLRADRIFRSASD